MVKQAYKECQLSFSGVYLIFCLVVTSSTRTAAFVSHLEWGPDLSGPWCAQRPRGQDCCSGRDDLCAVPILGTECYCDVFCNQTANDCCPDYFSHCHGYQWPTTTPRPTTLLPPRTTRATLESCNKNGRAYKKGAVIQKNCNNCTCDYIAGRNDWRCTDEPCLIRPELIQEINDGPYTWTATNYSDLWGLTLDDGTRFRLGTFPPDSIVSEMNPIRASQKPLPSKFDSREHWPNLISPVTDQGNCGSSWAHTTAALASDRLNIQSNGALDDVLSVQHLLSCADRQHGCNGGSVDGAWWFMKIYGVVSEKCYPYNTSHHNDPRECLIPNHEKFGECPSKAEFKRGKRFRATPPYKILSEETEIMKEILDNGPVQAVFRVREDFFMYKSGVYKYTNLISRRGESEKYMKSGFHSVRIIGWGTEFTSQGDVIKYWICANSWGPQWGEGGYFRIQRGTDESSIESFVIGVIGTVAGDEELRLMLDRKKQIKKDGRRRRYLRHLKLSKDQKGQELVKQRHRRHNINKIESYMDDDYTTGKKVRYYKPKSKKTKKKVMKKGKKFFRILKSEKKN